MSLVLNTNTNAVFASNAVNITSIDQSKAMQQLATGKRINSASDDAAGSDVVGRMAYQIAGLNQAVKNANDGISLGQTYDAAAQTIANILTRMQTLATQISSGTYSTADATNANQEFGQLQSEITRIASNTKWNGTMAVGASAAYTVQVGYSSGDSIVLNLGALSATSLGSASVGSASIATAGSASTALASISAGLSALNSSRAVAGAVVNRLQDTVTVLMNLSQRTQEAQSQIESTDYAAASSTLAKDNVLLQAGTAMLAQANQQPQYILTLLK